MLSKLCTKRLFGNFHVERNSKFATLNSDDMSVFKDIVGQVGMVTEADDLVSHNTDWTKKFIGSSGLMLKPQTNEEISACLKHCNDRNIAVVPQAGNTNKVGGAVPVHDEVIINTSRMNRILDFDESYGIVSSEAGVILRNLCDYTIDRGYEVPLVLGSKSSCQIGGSLANNAGGHTVIRHNSLHANTIGLKCVLADGTILDNMTTLRKDNTGYDLKHLFIGSEGTLGIITEMSMLCPPRPTKKSVALVCLDSFDDVLKLLHKTKLLLGDTLYAYECMDSQTIEHVRDQSKNCVFPFNNTSPFYVLIETRSRESTLASSDDSEKNSDLDKLLQLFETSEGLVKDAVVG